MPMTTIDKTPNPAPIAPPISTMHKANPAQAITANTIAAIRSRLNFLKSVFISTFC